MREVCDTEYGTYLKCPFSDILYQEWCDAETPWRCYAGFQDWFTWKCPNDALYYQACGNFRFQRKVHQGKTVALCGYYICDEFWSWKFAVSGSFYNYLECNNNQNCIDNADEKYCPEYYPEESFRCFNTTRRVLKSQVCDGVCDCRACEEEYDCNGFKYSYECANSSIEFPAIARCNTVADCPQLDDEQNCTDNPEYACETDFGVQAELTNYTRCFHFVYCLNKHDQTNCSDTSLVGLTCSVQGRMSTISRNIICNTARTWFNGDVRNYSGVCDDHIDAKCISPEPNCFLHKHQLCDNTKDCEGNSDESGSICKYQTAKSCSRRVNGKTLSIPVTWLGDGIRDCVDGLDEDLSQWPVCDYQHFQIYGMTDCTDVYLCPSGSIWYIALENICDNVVACEESGDICITPLFSDIMDTTTILKGTNYLSFCLPGLHDIERKYIKCTISLFPIHNVLGTQRVTLRLPNGKISCKYFYGTLHIHLSCSNKCSDTDCILTERADHNIIDSIETCRNFMRYGYPRYSLSEDGTLVFVKEIEKSIHVQNVYQCKNGRCISFDKVCNLMDDCGDGSDEYPCYNSFPCDPGLRRFIPLSSVCDGTYDCADLSDEDECCQKYVIENLVLKIICWVIGVIGVSLNGYVIIRNLRLITNIKLSVSFDDRLMILLINIGDFLTGCYLVAIAAVDAFYHDNFCVHRFDWLLSWQCSFLGIISTSGSQISLFAMSVLSMTRTFSLTSRICVPRPPTKRELLKTGVLAVAIVTMSVSIAMIPLLTMFEDSFVNALYYPEVNFLNGFVTKSGLNHIFVQYYGRTKLNTRFLPWRITRILIKRMFSNSFGSITERTLHFYGNDPVCLFKYFVTVENPQMVYTWIVLSFNLLNFSAMSLLYIKIGIVASASSSRVVGNAKSKSTPFKKRNQRLQRKIAMIITTDFFCWIPFIFLSFMHTLEVVNAIPWYPIFSVVVLPINSVINPLLYDDIIAKAGNRFKAIYSKFSLRVSSALSKQHTIQTFATDKKESIINKTSKL